MEQHAFVMDKGWLPFDASPSKPAFLLPAGSVDAHCHVFGPGNKFPYAPERKYTPCDASKEKLWELRDFLGVSRNVIVQATCHGTDNRALVDALWDAKGCARGIATVHESISESELEKLHGAGVRGVRFNFLKRLVDVTPQSTLRNIVAKIRPLGWHVVIYFEAEDLPDLHEFFSTLEIPLVVDHMGRPDVRKSIDGPEFRLFQHLLNERETIWCKVSCPERLSFVGPPYDDVVPFAHRIVELFPDRVLWGTDWPHPNMKSHMPDDGKLVDYIPRVATTAAAQRKLLVDNPMRLYWPEEAR